MKTTVKEILALAASQIGTKEEPIGSKNVKYNTAYYGGTVRNPNLHWCVVFLWWLFREMNAYDMFFGGLKTASCTTLYTYHYGQRVTDYQPGDIIFFNFNGQKSTAHVGICESWDGKNITTIDGNTSSTSQANGGTVARRVRDKKYIVGAYRPEYKEEMELTREEIIAIVNEVLDEREAARAAAPAADWDNLGEFDKAIQSGLTDGTRPESYPTRMETAVIAQRVLEKAVEIARADE